MRKTSVEMKTERFLPARWQPFKMVRQAVHVKESGRIFVIGEALPYNLEGFAASVFRAQRTEQSAT